ncbi:B12-binding domain-containing radical SAM protein [Peptoniphilus sp. KCTC 25270]|uniref:radical SAM protein n=1 Tax=Peptoniphilus sp. KCTC 25270 TaxID=2897414 RepID=UPI001E3CA255|nr:radical SAM protein [Peptoniphilus sp. KCTC 25270]MCD1147680.1 B12-binding domain-containing radical SAM protein [Peptoniphilus sp. KCTC 25270]
MRYQGSIYRPPSEAWSYILQATVGCGYNRCTFCTMYKDEHFFARPLGEIVEDLQMAHQAYGDRLDKIFIADGDSLLMPTEDLLTILKTANQLFPNLKRLSSYATTKSILSKTPEEWKLLRENNLKMIYLGIESGSGTILENIQKGVTPEEIIESGKRVREAGIELSVTFINGLGSHALSDEHAIESARVINAIEPEYIGLLTLLLEPAAPMYKDVAEGRFELLDSHEVLKEIRKMVEHIDVKHGVFRANHASNFVPLKGTFPQDKEKILATIDQGLQIEREKLESKIRGL